MKTGKVFIPNRTFMDYDLVDWIAMPPCILLMYIGLSAVRHQSYMHDPWFETGVPGRAFVGPCRKVSVADVKDDLFPRSEVTRIRTGWIDPWVIYVAVVVGLDNVLCQVWCPRVSSNLRESEWGVSARDIFFRTDRGRTSRTFIGALWTKSIWEQEATVVASSGLMGKSDQPVNWACIDTRCSTHWWCLYSTMLVSRALFGPCSRRQCVPIVSMLELRPTALLTDKEAAKTLPVSITKTTTKTRHTPGIFRTGNYWCFRFNTLEERYGMQDSPSIRLDLIALSVLNPTESCWGYWGMTLWTATGTSSQCLWPKVFGMEATWGVVWWFLQFSWANPMTDTNEIFPLTRWLSFVVTY